MPATHRDALQADHPGQPGLDRKKHFIFYRLGPDCVVEIIRVLHQSRNVPSHLLTD
jgi:plasmid stabilization system protein ParE